MLKYGDATSTGFTIDVDERQYLVTAKHVVADLQGEDQIEVHSNRNWMGLNVQLVGHAPKEIDVSVLAVERLLTPPNLPMEPTFSGVFYGQDAYFLGFPYGWTGTYIQGEGGFPFPFVKRATVSLLDKGKLYLDGHNNPGFSGGPVVFNNPKNRSFKAAAVISSYAAVPEPVLWRGQEADLTYDENTGIIEAFAMTWATDLIADNPIGHAIDIAK